MSSLRVAVIGAGFGAGVHAPAFRAQPGCEVVALCARREERARQAAGALGVAATTSWETLIADRSIDVITIATPPAQQVTIGRAALAAGKHVFFEKPLAVTSNESAELVTLAERVVTAVDFEFAEIDAFVEAKQRIAELGALRYAAVTWHVETYANKHRLTSWKTTAAEGGATLGNFTSHCLHYVEWLLGPLAWIDAHLARGPADDRPGETVSALHAATNAGVPVSISVFADAPHGTGHRVEIYGDRGALVLDNPGADYLKGFTLRFNDSIVCGPSKDERDGRVAAVERLAARFVEAIRRGGRCRPDVHDGHRVQVLLDAARESDMVGRRVRLPESS